MTIKPILTDLNGQYVKGNPKTILQNKDVISNEIINVLTCTCASDNYLGDRPFEPTYGGTLDYFLHEPVDNFTANNIKTCVFTSLGKWIPHIQVYLNDIDVIPNADGQYYEIAVYWKYSLTGQVGSTKFRAYYSGGSQVPVQN